MACKISTLPARAASFAPQQYNIIINNNNIIVPKMPRLDTVREHMSHGATRAGAGWSVGRLTV